MNRNEKKVIFEMRICTKCRARVSDTEEFCTECGHKFSGVKFRLEMNDGTSSDTLKKSNDEASDEHEKDVKKYFENHSALQQEKAFKWQESRKFIFGSYYQESGEVRSPIEWIVLEENGDTALLISKYALDCKPYNSENIDTTWQTSAIRKWLNTEFINQAFSDTERKKIQKTAVTVSDNSVYKINGGNATEDEIFLLSIEEAEKYFPSDEARICEPTEYALFNGAKACGGCWWSLRSSGHDRSYNACVSAVGAINTYGSGVCSPITCVRPALRIDMKL